MLNRRPSLQCGFTLIELLITVAVLGIVLMIALPNMGTWIQNTQIRTSAEAMQNGLMLARAEALKRNTTVRFQLVSDLSSTCTYSDTGRNWVVSLNDASGACDAGASDTTAPFIIQKRSGMEGSPNAEVSATGGSTVLFSGLGRAMAGSLTEINVRNTVNGACKTPAGNEPMRCLRVTVSPGGGVRMCDPAVNEATDPRMC